MVLLLVPINTSLCFIHKIKLLASHPFAFLYHGTKGLPKWPAKERSATIDPMSEAGVERPDLVKRSAPFLPPGSHIRQIFVCQTTPYFWLFVVNYFTFLTIFWIQYRCVAITDDTIYVLESTKFSGGSKLGRS